MAFSVNEAISVGWSTFRSRPGIFFGAGTVVGLVQVVPSLVQAILAAVAKQADDLAVALSAVSLLLSIFSLILSLLVSVGTVNFFVRAHDRVESVALGDLWFPRAFWRYLGVISVCLVAVLLGTLVIGGAAAVVASALGNVPVGPFLLGALVAFALAMAACFPAIYLVVDRGRGPIVAVREGLHLVQGHYGKILLYFLSVLLLNLAGALALLLGLAVTIPITGVASAHVYRRLLAASGEVATP